MKDQLKAYKTRVIETLKETDKLSMSQLAGGGGPLLHVPSKTRKKILNSLAGAGLIVSEKIQGKMGAPSTFWRVTPLGRKTGHEAA